MQGRRLPSFFPTKKKPAPAGETDGRMNPLLRASLIYPSMAALSGAEREKSLPRGGQVPGSRSIAQSYGLWGGREAALVLLKTSQRSSYSEGNRDDSGGCTGTLGGTGLSLGIVSTSVDWTGGLRGIGGSLEVVSGGSVGVSSNSEK